MHRTAAGKTRIGWIGTGVMGRWMCKHVMDSGFTATVYSRTREKARPLLNEGASWAESPAAVTAAADVVFTIVGTPEDVRAVYFGEMGIISSARPGMLLVDMTTTRPSLAEEIFRTAASKGVHALDAPVSGGDVGAREARLSIMVGGEREAFEAAAPLFEAMGRKIVYQGVAGAGQHAKMCNQIMIAGTMIGMCESLLYGARAGLDLETMLAGISGGAAACWSLDNLAPRILRKEFDSGFFVEHFVKDMGIALDEARRMNLALPGLALVDQLYHGVMAHGGRRLGTQALMLALARMNHIDFED
ncbi:NAD(P)-dependent oxidoreductase [Desulfococcus multivorans]|uniref:6-phosphogluconate dehydrogenase NAD-binding protein n=1 Tax=Desulfococcus multivorans DSM 2059 TaxID=1121405 RepID=S7UK35_DESML|nr:NAD(P)-dependent oxidoreductase [Desulfococcus multivorans]AOY59523.1 GarR: 2-hydroxy-3-oxopropionate reductase [Desulfococcus multivorans]AQV01718.1 oxidoreductase [Desulfococcus multivorans]EPR34169.1 6-phosphogluconate dehydrogenase NAD-binding protein [Desulfococcus multivorans DSM 2059]SKA19660.1 3-hydroxyisobutyrate dehydrogenase [Desulfococcus multivorans DSM 2059]